MNTSNGISRIKSNTSNHISDLPDCVISYILSRLPMLDAVKTSILSKIWQFTSIYKIELDDKTPCKIKSNKTAFVNFVERTLRLSHAFRNFRLSCAKTYESSDIETWISTALARNLHCLEICYHDTGIVLSPDLVNCNSLRKLELIIPCTLKLPAKICFPHLIALRLERVKILNECPNFDTTMFDFPVLETFELIRCKWLNVKCVEIYAPKRTTFKYEAVGGLRGNYHSIMILEDGLVKLESCDSLPGYIFLSGGLEIDRAVFGITADPGISSVIDDLTLEKTGLQIRKLLEGFLSLKYLHLWSNVAEISS